MAEKKTESKSKKETPKSGKSAALPLFYKEPMPLDKDQHAKLGLKKNFGYAFTKQVNAVPANMIELPQLSTVYPIAFSPDATATPVAIMGLRDNENLFVNAKGEWEDVYIPAYIRRYPFIFSETGDGERLTLCIDNNKDILQNGGDQLFFDDKGEASILAQNALEFCKSYHGAAQQTIGFGAALNDMGLLTDRTIQLNVDNKAKINFSGFRIIDEGKLNTLEDDKFLELRKKGYLPFIYAQLFSGTQWARLSHLLSARLDKEKKK